MKKYLISKVKVLLELFDKHNIKNKNQEKIFNKPFDDSNYRIVYSTRVYDEEKIHDMTTQSEFSLILNNSKNKSNDIKESETKKNKSSLIWSLVRECALR
jgi:hypothetical protein